MQDLLGERFGSSGFVWFLGQRKVWRGGRPTLRGKRELGNWFNKKGRGFGDPSYLSRRISVSWFLRLGALGKQTRGND